MQDNGKFALNKTGLLAYSHGEYFDLWKITWNIWLQCEKEEKGEKEKIIKRRISYI